MSRSSLILLAALAAPFLLASIVGCDEPAATRVIILDPHRDLHTNDMGNAGAASDAGEGGTAAVGVTVSRLMPDQVNTVFGQLLDPADGGTPVSTRSDVLAHGGLVFPAKEVAPSFRVPLMLIGLDYHALDNGFCAGALAKVSLSAGPVTRESISTLGLLLWSAEPTDADQAGLMRVGQALLPPVKGSPADAGGAPGGLMLVCAAMVRDLRFVTY